VLVGAFADQYPNKAFFVERHIMKICSNPNCSEANPQPLEKFYNNRRNKDGKMDKCKTCRNKEKQIYRNTSQGKAKRRLENWRYRNTEYGNKMRNEHKKKYNSSEKAKKARQKLRDPIKQRSHYAVSNAIKKGNLPPPQTQMCSAKCGSPAIEYHHYAGYTPENHLKVIPLCKKCHQILHTKNPVVPISIQINLSPSK
jgi:hypothetical protein